MTLVISTEAGKQVGRVSLAAGALTASNKGAGRLAAYALRKAGGDAALAYRALSTFSNGYLDVSEEPDTAVTLAAEAAVAPAAMTLPGIPVPDDPAAVSMFTAHRVNSILHQLAHAVERLQVAQKAAGQLRAYHVTHVNEHLRKALDSAHELTVNLREHYRAEAAELEQVKKTIGLAKAVSPTAKAVTFAHLLETTLHELTHAALHAAAMTKDDPGGDEWAFDADHCKSHLEGAVEHAGKIWEHLVDNYPAEGKWLLEIAGITHPDDPPGQEHAGTISGQLDLSWKDAWRTELRGPHGEWEHGAAAALRAAGNAEKYPGPGEPEVSGQASQAAVQGVMHHAADALPAMFAAGDHLDWDAQPPTLFADGSRDTGHGTTLAGIDWRGHMEMARSVADGLAADQKSSGPVASASNYTVALHEMIHAVVPAGQHRTTNGDRQAYQDYGTAQIEEGFTELGTIQHAEDFFDQEGIGDRPVLDHGTPAQQRHLAELNGQPLPAPDLTASKTMDETAEDINTPARIRAGDAWGHYPQQTAQAYEWASMIASMHTGKPEGDPATAQETLDIADQVNAVGAAAKLAVMARHVAGDIDTSPAVMEKVLAATENSIKSEWSAGEPVQAVYSHARQAAVQRQVEAEAERTPA